MLRTIAGLSLLLLGLGGCGLDAVDPPLRQPLAVLSVTEVDGMPLPVAAGPSWTWESAELELWEGSHAVWHLTGTWTDIYGRTGPFNWELNGGWFTDQGLVMLVAGFGQLLFHSEEWWEDQDPRLEPTVLSGPWVDDGLALSGEIISGEGSSVIHLTRN